MGSASRIGTVYTFVRHAEVYHRLSWMALGVVEGTLNPNLSADAPADFLPGSGAPVWDTSHMIILFWTI